jgi:hypothetical protein
VVLLAEPQQVVCADRDPHFLQTPIEILLLGWVPRWARMILIRGGEPSPDEDRCGLLAPLIEPFCAPAWRFLLPVIRRSRAVPLPTTPSGCPAGHHVNDTANDGDLVFACRSLVS